MGPSAGLDRCGKSRPTGIRSPDRPARSQLLYRLSYLGPQIKCCEAVKFCIYFFFPIWRCGPTWSMASSFLRFLDHTTHFSGRVISSSQRPLSDNIQHSEDRSTHVAGGIRTHNRRKRAAADPRLKQRGHWDLSLFIMPHVINKRLPERILTFSGM